MKKMFPRTRRTTGFTIGTMMLAASAAAPALAWEAGREDGLCTLTHSEPSGDIVISYDPAGPLYTLSASRTAPWPEAPFFGIAFLGGAEITITTDRHALSPGALVLSVADSGFGNVLNGLAGNATATLFTTEPGFSVSLAGAAAAVADFEACGTTPLS